MVLNFQATLDVQFNTKCFWLSLNSYYWANPSHPFLGSIYTHPLGWIFPRHLKPLKLRCKFPPPSIRLKHEEHPTPNYVITTRVRATSLAASQEGREREKYIGWEFQEREWEGERQIVLHYSSRLLSDTNSGTPVRSVWESRTTRGFCQWNKQRQGRLNRVMFTLGDAHEDWKQMHTVGISCSR